jgi:DNA-binding MarR family transcriptional regulator
MARKNRPIVPDVIASLRSLASAMDRLDDVAARHYGLNRTDMRALEIVGRTGPLAPTQLAHLLGFTTGGITAVVDRLENAGYVLRRPDASDRRRLVIEATEATRRRDDVVFGELARLTAEMVTRFNDEDLNIVKDFLDRTRAITTYYSEGLTEDTPT